MKKLVFLVFASACFCSAQEVVFHPVGTSVGMRGNTNPDPAFAFDLGVNGGVGAGIRIQSFVDPGLGAYGLELGMDQSGYAAFIQGKDRRVHHDGTKPLVLNYDGGNTCVFQSDRVPGQFRVADANPYGGSDYLAVYQGINGERYRMWVKQTLGVSHSITVEAATSARSPRSGALMAHSLALRDNAWLGGDLVLEPGAIIALAGSRRAEYAFEAALGSAPYDFRIIGSQDSVHHRWFSFGNYEAGQASRPWREVFRINSFNGKVEGKNDIEITDASRGVVLRSPNGSRFRLTVSNDGQISAVRL